MWGTHWHLQSTISGQFCWMGAFAFTIKTSFIEQKPASEQMHIINDHKWQPQRSITQSQCNL